MTDGPDIEKSLGIKSVRLSSRTVYVTEQCDVMTKSVIKVKYKRVGDLGVEVVKINDECLFLE